MDLLAELIHRSLLLSDRCSKKGVLFKTFLVLNDHGRDAKPLKSPDRKDEVLRKPACIPIKNYRLGGYLQGIIEPLQSGCKIHRLDVRLALGDRIGKRACPHAVKLTLYVVYSY